MASHPQSRLPVRAVLVVIMVITPLSILVSMPWLMDQPDELVFMITGIAATVTVLAALVFSVLQDRRLDEWHRSAARFSTQWGYSAGASLVALLLALPPVRDLIVSLAAGLAGVSEPNHQLVIFAFVGGFIATVLTQSLSTALISIVWVSWKSRAPTNPS